MTNSHTTPTGRDPLTGAWTDEPLHDDPTIAAFLADGGYDSIEAWMRDSDYLYVEDSFGDGSMIHGWVDLDDNPVGAPEGVIEGAIEASGFEA